MNPQTGKSALRACRRGRGLGCGFAALRSVCLALGLALCTATVRADVKVHGLFSDNMVLQRDVAVPVWGWADEGETVTVEFRGQKVSAKTKDGAWSVRLGKMKAGGPDELKISGKNRITLKNVLVGEVWIASGQSNMEWPLRASFDSRADIALAGNPRLRLYTVPKRKANEPVKDLDGAWEQCGPNSVSNFSAVAYYFGRFLQKDLKVPVGLIHTSWGGSPAEVWIRHQWLAANPNYQRDILDAFPAQLKKYEEALAQFEKEQAEAQRDGKPLGKNRPWGVWKPCELYNGMIAPLIPYAIRGAIWYQGESNAGRAHQYRTLFPDLISNWRKDWGQGDFPFLQVQLAPFMAIKDQPGESSWAELREAQLHATQSLPKVGLAVITDLGDEKDIHPRWKKPVGYRLALAARGIAYGEKIVYSGPTYRSLKIKGDKAIVRFDQVGEGLFGRALPPGTKPGVEDSDRHVLEFNMEKGWLNTPLAGFAIAGEDRKFVWGKAEIRGDTVVVSSPQVPRPVAVRYGWADYPVVNLYCAPGPLLPALPASPFRTDHWPMTTEPKQEAKK